MAESTKVLESKFFPEGRHIGITKAMAEFFINTRENLINNQGYSERDFELKHSHLSYGHDKKEISNSRIDLLYGKKHLVAGVIRMYNENQKGFDCTFF